MMIFEGIVCVFLSCILYHEVVNIMELFGGKRLYFCLIGKNFSR